MKVEMFIEIKYYFSNRWNQEVYQILLCSAIFDEEKLLKGCMLEVMIWLEKTLILPNCCGIISFSYLYTSCILN